MLSMSDPLSAAVVPGGERERLQNYGLSRWANEENDGPARPQASAAKMYATVHDH